MSTPANLDGETTIVPPTRLVLTRTDDGVERKRWRAGRESSRNITSRGSRRGIRRCIEGARGTMERPEYDAEVALAGILFAHVKIKATA